MHFDIVMLNLNLEFSLNINTAHKIVCYSSRILYS